MHVLLRKAALQVIASSLDDKQIQNLGSTVHVHLWGVEVIQRTLFHTTLVT